MESKDNAAGAVEYYRKCLSAATEAGDAQSEALATYRLGLACAKLPAAASASASASAASTSASASAPSTSASASASASSASQQSIEHQTRYLQLTQKLGDAHGEGAACAALAKAYQVSTPCPFLLLCVVFTLM